MTQYSKAIGRLLIAMVSILALSCDKDTEFAEYDFVGDSLVARWDVQTSFPTSIVRNYGVSGSGIDYLESLAGKFAGKTVVVISGTNDMATLQGDIEANIAAYAKRYLQAIKAFGADAVYLYCVFPRGKEFDGEEMNSIILAFNAKVKAMLAADPLNVQYIDVYQQLAHDGLLNPQYSCDGLHLNIYGYEVITNALMSK